MTVVLLAALVLGHDLPDDVVQCGMQLVVHGDTIELRYQCGLNAATARDTLHQWGVPHDPAAPVFPLLREQAFERLTQRLRVTVDGVPVTLKPVSVKEVRRHHARVECVYEFPNPSAPGGVHEIAIRDDNFARSPGLREIAVKSRADVAVTTDAPQVLGRSDLVNEPNQQLGPRQLSLVVGAGEPANNPLSPIFVISCLVLIGVRGASVTQGKKGREQPEQAT